MELQGSLAFSRISLVSSKVIVTLVLKLPWIALPLQVPSFVFRVSRCLLLHLWQLWVFRESDSPLPLFEPDIYYN